MGRKGNNKPLTKIVADEIIEFIKENNLKPGDRLKNEYELAEHLKVSRSTLREAIKSLVSRNILEVRQGAGTFVSSKSGIPEDPLGLTFVGDDETLMLDVLDVRLILEPEIAAIAALKATHGQLSRMLDQCEIVEKLILQNKDYREADALFHQRIAECTGNKVIGNLIPVINSSVALNIGGTKDQYKMCTINEHKNIAEAIKRGDSLGAKYAMISHLNTTRNGIIKSKRYIE